MIQLFRPNVGAEEIQAVGKLMEAGWLGLGPNTTEFEARFAEYVGSRFAVGVSSGTAALHIALLAYGVGPGDEVIVPSLTAVSSTHAILYVGATPVFADVLEDTLCIDPEDVKRKITTRTKVIMPVHYGGHPCDMNELHEVVERRGIPIVEDAAHACGAVYRGRRIGAISEVTCFSFHALKNLVTGEGGAITTNDSRVNDLARRLRLLGINKDSQSFTSDLRQHPWYFEVAELGYKYYLNDIGAAIGMVQLRRLEETNARRRTMAQHYTAELASLPWLSIPAWRDYVVHAYQMFVIRTPFRDRLHLHLKERGVASGVHFVPIHLYPLYREYPAEVPVTGREWLKLLTIPCYPALGDADVEQVLSSIKSFVP